MRRVLTLAALSAAAVLALGGVAHADAEVQIGDDGLDPQSVEVDVREPIVWTNATDSEVSLVGEDPEWESGPIAPGATFSIEITEAGTYTYGSEDGSLQGEIVVGGGGGGGGGEGTEPPDEGDSEEDVVEEEPESRGGGGGGADDEEPPLPETGTESVLPAVLSLLLIVFGAGLVRVTDPVRVIR